MKKTNIYLDTSVISYLDQPERGEKYQETHMLWQQIKQGEFDVYLSDVTIEEIGECGNDKYERLVYYLDEIDYTRLETTEEIKKLAREIINRGFLTSKSYDDCMHIAHATVANCENLLSWNFKHLVTVRTINGVREINIFKGYPIINILAPSAMIYAPKEQGEE
jgi:predicted nucleic acid-binding protein